MCGALASASRAMRSASASATRKGESQSAHAESPVFARSVASARQ